MSTRRAFVRAALAAAVAGVVLPLVPAPVNVLAADELPESSGTISEGRSAPVRAAGDPAFEPFWVATQLPTRLWPTPTELDDEVGTTEPGRLFRVDAPQDAYRLPVWDPRENRHVYIGSEAVSAADPPFWGAFADNGRWIDVTLSGPQHVTAMQGDLEVRRELISAGVERRTKPGFYRIKYRVFNETMDSRTVPDATHQYLLKDVLYTQYFDDEGSAIHYNWWATVWGAPGSQGCLGMMLDGARFMWEWANINTPLAVHY